jgi:hypothetical protein
VDAEVPDMNETPTQDWIPDEVDTTVPSMARAYDYLLGGAHNFAVDRMVADHAEKMMPGAAKIARLSSTVRCVTC